MDQRRYHERFDRLKAQIETASRRVGTELGPKKWYFEPLHGEEYIDIALKVGRIRESIAERTLPTLTEKFEKRQLRWR